jgi:hypothetical protein
MDNNFQTSFIPKKALAEDRTATRRRVSLYGLIAGFIFFGALISAAATYFYKGSLTTQIASMSSQLDAARNAFEPSLINELQRLDRRIGSAETLLSNHIVVSPVFTALQSNTLKSIQFTKFSYVTPPDPGAPVSIKITGRARDYTSIALESDQLSKNKDIHKYIF